MRKHDAHVREFRRMLLNRYPWPKDAVFVFIFFIFFIFVMGIYLGYEFYTDRFFIFVK